MGIYYAPPNKALLEEMNVEMKKIIGKEVVCTSDNDEETAGRIFHVFTKKGRVCIASFKLAQMPGCCGLLVSYNSGVAPPFRNKGVASALHKIKIKMAKDWGYSAMMCTDIVGNKPQEKILTKNKWATIANFKNRHRTDNDVAVRFLEI